MKNIIISLFLFLSFSSLGKGLFFEKAWVRAVPKVSAVSAGFGVLKNTTNRERKLVKVESPISEIVEIHSMERVAGVMKMRKIEFLKIGKNSSRKLKPGSYHIMFINLKKPLKEGEKAPVTLFFDNGYKLHQEVEIKKI